MVNARLGRKRTKRFQQTERCRRLFLPQLLLVNSVSMGGEVNQPAPDKRKTKQQKNVPLIVIDEQQRDNYLDAGYNRPRDEVLKANFMDEWYKVFDTIRESVSQKWRHGIGEEGDFFMERDCVADRLLCIEISDAKMLSDTLIWFVHDALLMSRQNYSIDICDDWVFLKTSKGERHPHFNIFVEPKQILVFSESDEFLKQLGVANKREN